MSSTPLALPPILPSELLTYILAHQAFPTTLIICKPRAAFLDSLLQCVTKHQSIPPESLQAAQAQDETPDLQPDDHGTATSHSDRHPLLIPSLYQVATSRYINLIFLPTVSHLRAYLAVFPSSSSPSPSRPRDLRRAGPPEQQFQKTGTQKPLLVLYGLVEMHRSTSEWSVQGLSRSLAALVEAGRIAGRKVVVMEERTVSGEEEEEQHREVLDGNELEEERREDTLRVWEERVPMLNGSIRRAGFESEDGEWSGRTVAVGRILERWFRFARAA